MIPHSTWKCQGQLWSRLLYLSSLIAECHIVPHSATETRRDDSLNVNDIDFDPSEARTINMMALIFIHISN